MPNLLEVTDVRVAYGAAVAVRDVSLTAPGGQVTAVVGPNGAGKTSLVLATYGSQPADGTVHVNGQDLSSASAYERAMAGIAIVPQGRQLFPRLSVRDNLRVMAETLHLPPRVVEEAMERFPILGERASASAGVLSGGEQQMLVAARALMSDPKVLLLDEMVTGLAPLIVEELAETIAAMAAKGVAIVLAAPEIGAIRHVVDRGVVLLRGEVVERVEDGGAALDRAYQAAMGMDLADATGSQGSGQ